MLYLKIYQARHYDNNTFLQMYILYMYIYCIFVTYLNNILNHLDSHNIRLMISLIAGRDDPVPKVILKREITMI